MVATAEDRAINRKLTAVTKGVHRQLDRTEIPEHDCYLSPSNTELYHYDKGLFEAYPENHQHSLWSFWTHHTLKVISTDAVPVAVGLNGDASRYHVLEVLPEPKGWTEITTPTEVERLYLERNKRHLQHVAIEGGIVDHPIKKALCEDYGVGPNTDRLLAGLPVAEYENVPPVLEAWI